MNYSEKFLDVMNIGNSLTNEELLNICNGNFKKINETDTKIELINK